MHVLSRFSHVWLFATPWTIPPRLCSWDSPGKNTGVVCHALLQGIFPTQGLHLCLLHLLHWQVGSLPLVPPVKPLELINQIYIDWIKFTSYPRLTLSDWKLRKILRFVIFVSCLTWQLSSEIIWKTVSSETRIDKSRWQVLCVVLILRK